MLSIFKSRSQSKKPVPKAPAAPKKPAVKSKNRQQSNPLSQITHIVAIGSGKGGVGKSTTAVNLAFGLKSLGCRVGLLDADIYGPSVPMMTGAGKPQQMRGDLVVPPEIGGIPIVSGGMFTSPDKAQAMRGPMIGNLLKQFLTQVDWGKLDFLIVDCPPGTGDIQLTLAQEANLSASVMVTTPQKVATADVKKSIDMFHQLNVPIIGIVETLSYFQPEKSSPQYRIFGSGGADNLAKQYGFPVLSRIPIEPEVSEAADSGKIAIRDLSQSETAKAYLEAANWIKNKLELQQMTRGQILEDFTLVWRTNN